MTSVAEDKTVANNMLADYAKDITHLAGQVKDAKDVKEADDIILTNNTDVHAKDITLLASQVKVKEADDVVLYIPANYVEKVGVIWRQVRWIVKLAIVTTKRGKTLPKDLETQLLLFLRAMNNVEMNAKLGSATQIRKVFEAIVQEPTHFKLPQKYADMIEGLWRKWEDDKWGKGDGEDDDEEEEVAEVQTTATVTIASVDVTSLKETSQANKDDKTLAIRRPHRMHPIYGANGIMRGIITMQKKSRVYLLDDTFPRVNAKVFGHNGLTVGAWWPMQLAALRDGAHGARIGGIAGSTEKGTYSIVVSGQYSKLDQDFGSTLYYSGSGSGMNTSKTPADTRATRCLIRSIETGEPVRVLRAAGGSGAAPSVGIRYDGLYRIEGKKTLENNLGGAFLQFKLVRQARQDAMNYVHPTLQEQRDTECIKHGY